MAETRLFAGPYKIVRDRAPELALLGCPWHYERIESGRILYIGPLCATRREAVESAMADMEFSC
jgi:hypothetical protein